MPAPSSAITRKMRPCRRTPRRHGLGRDVLVAHERAALARMSEVYSKCVSSVVEGDRVAIHWNFVLTEKSGLVRRFDEIAWQEWRGDKIFRERFFYDPTKSTADDIC